MSEKIYRMKNIPRSYDMSRTHIMHKEESKHVDVVLKSAPKNWKKKPVKVHVVSSEKRKENLKIRVGAKKGYVAVKKDENKKYAVARKQIERFDEKNVIDYETVHLKNRSLIQDIKSQIALMAKKSSDYINEQLEINNSQTAAKTEKNIKAESAMTLEQNIENQMASSASQFKLKQNDFPESRPYANNYSKHVSDAEFRSLMDSLEKSLDEAYRRTGMLTTKSDAPQNQAADGGFATASHSGYSQNKPLSVDVSQVTHTSQNQTEKDESNQFKPVAAFPVSQEKKTVFSSVEKDKYIPVSQPEEEQDFTPILISKEEEQEFYPMTAPEEEEQEFRPILIPEEEEQEFRPILIPERDDFSQTSANDYQPQKSATVNTASANYKTNSSDINHYDLDHDDKKYSQTLLSRTGDKIRKVIGVIRGKPYQENSAHVLNEDVDISYSDNDNNNW